jgi:uncharacterized protein (TIGR00255 family)
MTGFGVGDVPLAGGRVVAEARSVNQRFLDVRARLPRELGDLTLMAEQVARERLRRGRVELVVRTEGPVLAACEVDKERARVAFRALAELRDELAPGAEVPLSLLGSVPDLFVPPAGAELDAMRAAVQGAIGKAIDAMRSMCAREGACLATDLAARTALVRASVERIAELLPAVREAARRRLRARLEGLLQDVDVRVEPNRIETEIVLLCDRGDVSEELTRLASHLDQFDSALRAKGDEPVGRRLDFLMQEMVREVTTLAAKAQDAQVSVEVIAIKVELERMREQAQNVE